MLAACSREPNMTVGRGPETPVPGDKSLNVYNWTSFIEPSVIADFEKDFGVKVHYDVYDSNEMMEVKLLAGHTNYDVVVPGGSFFEKERKAGVYQKLDKSLLPNLKNLDPEAARAVGILDPGNEYGVDYMWLVTVGLGYDAAKIRARVPAAPVDSWRLIFDPQVAAKFQDCGISVLDSPDDVVGAALAYLGKDPNSESLEDLESAEKVLLPIRPYLRYIDSTRYFADLANGDICLALGWSGDVAQARQRANEAGGGVQINYSIPAEGSLSIVDVLAIPADAPHAANAHLFINYLLRPDVAAKNASTVTYASGVADSAALVSEELRNDTAVYPTPQARARLKPMRARSQEFTRSLMRMWTRFKTGQ
jgi:putrescine transport system substrate-binding protein